MSIELTQKQYIHFKDLPVGCEFSRNGNVYKKVSTRTAKITNPVRYAGCWFYFKSLDMCIVGKYSVLPI